MTSVRPSNPRRAGRLPSLPIVGPSPPSSPSYSTRSESSRLFKPASFMPIAPASAPSKTATGPADGMGPRRGSAGAGASMSLPSNSPTGDLLGKGAPGNSPTSEHMGNVDSSDTPSADSPTVGGGVSLPDGLRSATTTADVSCDDLGSGSRPGRRASLRAVNPTIDPSAAVGRRASLRPNTLRQASDSPSAPASPWTPSPPQTPASGGSVGGGGWSGIGASPRKKRAVPRGSGFGLQMRRVSRASFAAASLSHRTSFDSSAALGTPRPSGRTSIDSSAAPSTPRPVAAASMPESSTLDTVLGSLSPLSDVRSVTPIGRSATPSVRSVTPTRPCSSGSMHDVAGTRDITAPRNVSTAPAFASRGEPSRRERYLAAVEASRNHGSSWHQGLFGLTSGGELKRVVQRDDTARAERIMMRRNMADFVARRSDPLVASARGLEPTRAQLAVGLSRVQAHSHARALPFWQVA